MPEPALRFHRKLGMDKFAIKLTEGTAEQDEESKDILPVKRGEDCPRRHRCQNVPVT